MLFSLSARENIAVDYQRTTPDISARRAKQDSLLFMPGVTASLLVFLVFGTTRPFLDYMKRRLFSWRRRSAATSTDALPLRPIPRGQDVESCGVSTPEMSFQRRFHDTVVDSPDGRNMKAYGIWVYGGRPNPKITGERTYI